MKTQLGTKVDVGPGHIVLDEDPAPPAKGAQQPPSFRPMSIVATIALLSYSLNEKQYTKDKVTTNT